MGNITENLNRVRQRIAEAAYRCGRNPKEITLVAVTKTVSPERINEAIRAGVTIIGENRVQELRKKKEYLLPTTIHMIGHLQTNKAKYAVDLFDMIQSVDSYKLAVELQKRCESKNKKMPILIEVNTSGESSKFGCKPEETEDLVGKISEFLALEIKGLMTIGPLTENKNEVRQAFRMLKKLYENIRSQKFSNVNFEFLSMGMSSDFEVAVEEGSNMVRIGSAIFGLRPY